MKGITPIISIIILLLITVALAGAAWTFLQGFLFPQIQKSFMIPTGGSYCVSGKIKMYVLNTGYQSDLKRDDFFVRAIDGSDIDDVAVLKDISLRPGQSALLLDYDCSQSGSLCTSPVSGYHSVDLGTTSSVQHLSVYCP